MVRRVIALGTFDGVHAGHRRLLDGMLAIASQRGLRPMVYTFSNHPLEAFGRAPRRLMSDGDRMEKLREAAPVQAEEFTLELAAMPPGAFARRMAEELRMAVAVAGFNYTFGKGGGGDIAALRRYGEEYGFEVCEIQPMLYDNAPVSSTRIRERLEQGDVASANAMLGREYSLSGTVVGNRRIGGAVLGYPTANIPLDEAIVRPASGVYATYAVLGGREWEAVTNIGRNPTVGGRATTCETHIIGFEGSIYGERLTVRFVERLRGDMAFESVRELSAQIGRDVERAKGILGK